MLFRTLLLSLLLLVSLAAIAAQGQENEPGPARRIKPLIGEDCRYAMDFLVFSRLAAGELRFAATEQPNVYRAELIGRTQGIASWLTGERTQTYTSLMKQAPDGALLSVEHVSRVVKRRRGTWQKRERHYRYDYVEGKVFDEKTREGVLRSSKAHAIPSGQQPVDMLTAFYNLRLGVYGPLVPGARFLIPTYSKERFTVIEVTILTAEQQSAHRYFPAAGLLFETKIDPEIFDTVSGTLYFWLYDESCPQRGIVQDVIGLGDVRGYLDKEGL